MVAQTASDRAMPAEELASLVRSKLLDLGRCECDLVSLHATVGSALEAVTESHRPLIAAGTITLAGEVAGLLRG